MGDPDISGGIEEEVEKLQQFNSSVYRMLGYIVLLSIFLKLDQSIGNLAFKCDDPLASRLGLAYYFYFYHLKIGSQQLLLHGF